MSATVAVSRDSRQIGCWDTGKPGPTLFVTAGIHGNEPAGVKASERVLRELAARKPDACGRFIALRGNRQALAEGCRFLARDLNRGWGQEAIDRLQKLPQEERSPEDIEQLELLESFVEIERSTSGPLLFVDLHTSSAEGSPFLCLADTIDNRRLGLSTGVPIILGIEETIEGASLEWFADRGIAGFAVEGGQHDSEAAIDNHEAVLWGLLTRLGIVPEGFVDLAPHKERLQKAAGAAPAIVEIIHREEITPEDEFRMEPGFENFTKVQKGQLMARDRTGNIHAPSACHVMLPLYQKQGEDGFFLARRVRFFWLWLARWLRAMHLTGVLPLLPGIRRDPNDHDTLIVNEKVARWFVVEVFHLLGFRKCTKKAGRLAFRRRSSRPENRQL